jgi:hypothetical protein
MTHTPSRSLLAAARQLRDEIVGGLLYCHHRENTNTSKTLEVTAFTYGLIELLLEKGLITEAELNERKRRVALRLVDKLEDDGTGVLLQRPEIDKYAFEGGAEIDCENRVELCRAACCRMRFALSQQDLQEGVVQWELSRPYLIRRGPDGYCGHFGPDSQSCTIYQQRPVPCRAYDCRGDKRIWADFENRIVSPDLEALLNT